MEWGFFVLIVVAFLVGPAIGGAFHSEEFAGRFKSLGDIRGIPIEDIVARVGEPNSITAMPDGSLYQWLQQVGFSASHFAILVDMDGKAIGYQHQYRG